MTTHNYLLAERGCLSWTQHARTEHGTVQSHPFVAAELTAPIRIDWEPSFGDNPIQDVWRRPSLDLSLPDANVRDLMEGCIGHAGTTSGHPWDGGDVSACASVGLDVYVAWARRAGARVSLIDSQQTPTEKINGYETRKP